MRPAEPETQHKQPDRRQRSGQEYFHLRPVRFADPVRLLHSIQRHSSLELSQFAAPSLNVAPHLRDGALVVKLRPEMVADRDAVVLLLSYLKPAFSPLKHPVDVCLVSFEKYSRLPPPPLLTTKALDPFLQNLCDGIP